MQLKNRSDDFRCAQAKEFGYFRLLRQSGVRERIARSTCLASMKTTDSPEPGQRNVPPSTPPGVVG